VAAFHDDRVGCEWTVPAAEEPVQVGIFNRTCCDEGERIASIVTSDRFEQGVS
jgi:hypothetical protein